MKFIGFILISFLGFAACASVGPPKRESEPARWEKLGFELIDKTTAVSGMQPLRGQGLAVGDEEIRMWRGFGLDNFEGLILLKHSGRWSARHIVADHYIEVTSTIVTDLHAPQSGWNEFWEKLNSLGFLTNVDPADEDCLYGSVDGMAMVVEINRNGIYRTYISHLFSKSCQESQNGDLISELVGEEFYDGVEPCRRAEWFPCAGVLKKRRLAGDPD
jgi:hypothetical protein